MAEKDEFNIDLKNIAEEVALLRDAFSTIGATIAESINEQLEQTEGLTKRINKTVSRDVNRAFLNMVKGTDKILANNIKIQEGSLTQADIEKQLQGNEEKRLGVVASIEQARLAGIKITKRQEKAALKQLDIQEEILKKQSEEAKNLQDKLGVTGKLLKGLSKIPVLGNVIDAKEALGAAQKAAAGGASKLKVAFTGVGKALGSGLKSALNPMTILLAIGKMFFDTLMKVDKLNTAIAKTFGVSKNQANEINASFEKIKKNQQDGYITVTNLNKAFLELNKQSGTFAKFSEDTLVTFTELTEKGKLSAEAAGALNDLSILSGESLKDVSKEYAGQLAVQNLQGKGLLNEKALLEDIKNVSSSVTLQLGGSASAIAEAVFKAKELGLELKDLENISSSLLNFQSSIEDELSAELLTGKQLNLEGARYAALIGNQGMLAEELAKNIGTAADFTNMTIIAQDALAKSLGMNRNQLADTLIQQEKLNKLDAEGNTLQEKYNNLRKQGYSEADIAAKLEDEALARQLEGNSLQDDFNQLILKAQEALIPLAMELLPVIANLMKYLVDNAGTIAKVFKFATGAAGGAAIGTMIAPGIGTAIGAAIGGIGAAIGDGIFPAGGRAILSPTEGGLIPISNNDDIVVAPKLAQTVGNIVPISDNDDIVVAPRPAQAVAGGGTSQTVENKVDISPSNTNITLSLNGQAIGNANARQNYRVGKSIRALGGNVDYSASV